MEDDAIKTRADFVDGDAYRQALEALHRQQNCDAIAEGLAQMEAGEGLPVDDAFALMRLRLGWPQEP